MTAEASEVLCHCRGCFSIADEEGGRGPTLVLVGVQLSLILV